MTTRRLENAHVALWLLKDYAWCTSTKWLGLVMALPTIALAIMIARQSWKSLEDFTHNAAVCCWIAANITWMVGEFYFEDHTRRYAQIFFYAGLCLVVAYYVYVGLARVFRRRKLAPLKVWAAGVTKINDDLCAGRITDRQAQERLWDLQRSLKDMQQPRRSAS